MAAREFEGKNHNTCEKIHTCIFEKIIHFELQYYYFVVRYTSVNTLKTDFEDIQWDLICLLQ